MLLGIRKAKGRFTRKAGVHNAWCKLLNDTTVRVDSFTSEDFWMEITLTRDFTAITKIYGRWGAKNV